MEEAVKYIGKRLRDNPSLDKNRLITYTQKKFGLTALQTEYLLKKYVWN